METWKRIREKERGGREREKKKYDNMILKEIRERGERVDREKGQNYLKEELGREGERGEKEREGMETGDQANRMRKEE